MQPCDLLRTVSRQMKSTSAYDPRAGMAALQAPAPPRRTGSRWPCPSCSVSTTSIASATPIDLLRADSTALAWPDLSESGSVTGSADRS